MQIKRIVLNFALVFALLFVVNGAFAQKFVQLEVFGSVNTKKYAVGDKLVFKTTRLPGEWQKMKIERINYDDDVIVFSQGLVEVKNITHIRTINYTAKTFSTILYVFAASAAVFGIADLIFVEREIRTSIWLFTIPPAGLAFFFDRVVGRKVYHIGNNSRIRLLDLSM